MSRYWCMLLLFTTVSLIRSVRASHVVSDILHTHDSDQILNLSTITANGGSNLPLGAIVGNYTDSKGKLHVNATVGLVGVDFKYIRRTANDNGDAMRRVRNHTKTLAQNALSKIHAILDAHVIPSSSQVSLSQDIEHNELRRLLQNDVRDVGRLAFVVVACSLLPATMIVEISVLTTNKTDVSASTADIENKTVEQPPTVRADDTGLVFETLALIWLAFFLTELVAAPMDELPEYWEYLERLTTYIVTGEHYAEMVRGLLAGDVVGLGRRSVREQVSRSRSKLRSRSSSGFQITEEELAQFSRNLSASALTLQPDGHVKIHPWDNDQSLESLASSQTCG